MIWNAHINNVASKAQNLLGILRGNTSNKDPTN
jgi:hypothetical protein